MEQIISQEKKVNSIYLVMLLLIYVVLINVLFFAIIPAFYIKSWTVYIVNFDSTSCIFSGFFLIALFIHIVQYNRFDTLSDIVILMLELLYFIPGTIYFYLYADNIYVSWCHCLYWIVLVVSQHLIPKCKAKILVRYSDYKEKQNFWAFLLTIMIVGLAIIIGQQLGQGLRILFVEDIYDVRLAYRSRDVHWLITNFYTGLSVIIPILISYWTLKKKYILCILLFIGQIYIYSIACNKTFLYIAMAAFFIALFYVNKERVTLCLLLLSLVSIIEFMVFKTGHLLGALRRLTLDPAQIASYDYDFFITKHNPLFYMSQTWTRISSLVGFTSDYKESIGFVIGKYYATSSDINLNTGMLGAGLAKFGLLALIICPISNIIGLRIIECFSNKITNRKVIIVLALVLVEQLIDLADFISTFIKLSPMLMLIIFLLIFPFDMSVLEGKDEDSIK